MKVKLSTAILLIVTGLGIGWLAYQNLMWAVWGKQNAGYEYVGFWGCPIMLLAGLATLKSLRVGSYVGLLGYLLMLFFLGPALVNTFQAIAKTTGTLEPVGIVFLVLIVALSLLTLVLLLQNVIPFRSQARA
jgi:hypothetical protein